MLVGERPHSGEIAGRRHEDARGARNCLEHDGGDRRRPFALDHPAQVGERALGFLLGSLSPELAAIEVWPEEVDVTACELVRHATPVAGGDDGRTGVAMVRAIRREHFVAPGVEAGHADGVLVRIRPAVGEEDLVEAVGCA